MIAGEYICCDVGDIFHFLIVAFVHGAFETYIDESIGELCFFPAVFYKGFHVEFDFRVDIFDAE